MLEYGFSIRIARFKDPQNKDRWLILKIERDTLGDTWVQFKFSLSSLPVSIEEKRKMAEPLYGIYIEEKKNEFIVSTWWHRVGVPSDFTFAMNNSALKAYVKFFRLCGLDLSFESLKKIIERIEFLSKI